MTQSHQRNRLPNYRKKYKTKNWRLYELRERGENSRRVESVITCNILNQFKLLGSPHSELIA